MILPARIRAGKRDDKPVERFRNLDLTAQTRLFADIKGRIENVFLFIGFFIVLRLDPRSPVRMDIDMACGTGHRTAASPLDLFNTVIDGNLHD